VRLDRDFRAVADTRHYHVFLTAYGDSKGLFVSRRTRDGFQVREQGGGTARVRFSYRVVARRKDVTSKRFQKVTSPARPRIPAQLQRPEVDLGSSGRRASKRSKARRPGR